MKNKMRIGKGNVIKKHWLYGDIAFRVDVTVEDNCGDCIHWPVCRKDMSEFCLNYEFGRSEGCSGSCEQCLHRFTRWDKDQIPCFKCKNHIAGMVRVEK